jgi:hypothetical protein
VDGEKLSFQGPDYRIADDIHRATADAEVSYPFRAELITIIQDPVMIRFLLIKNNKKTPF